MTDDIKSISLEGLVNKVVEMQAGLEDIEVGIKVTKDEIQDRLKEMKLTGTKVGEYFVGRVKRLNTSAVTLPDARTLGATEQKEVINYEMLKKLYAKGIKIKGIKMIEFISIKENR